MSSRRRQMGFGGIGPAFFASGATLVVTTWNPADKNASINLSGGNTVATHAGGSGAQIALRGTVGIPATGQGYFEFKMANGSFCEGGIQHAAASLSTWVGNTPDGWAYDPSGSIYTNGTGTAYGSGYGTSDIQGVAFKNGSVWFSKNGVWQNGGNPSAGTGAAYTGLTGTIYPAASLQNTGNIVNGYFTAASFNYTPPAGFPAWGN